MMLQKIQFKIHFAKKFSKKREAHFIIGIFAEGMMYCAQIESCYLHYRNLSSTSLPILESSVLWKNVEWLFQRILSIRKQMDLYRFSYESMKHRVDKHVLEKRRRNK